MTSAQKALARQYARQINELERREDYGGLHSQATRELRGLIYTSQYSPRAGKHVERWCKPNGRCVASYREAEKAWQAAVR